jgi:hypothetical protein
MSALTQRLKEIDLRYRLVWDAGLANRTKFRLVDSLHGSTLSCQYLSTK